MQNEEVISKACSQNNAGELIQERFSANPKFSDVSLNFSEIPSQLSLLAEVVNANWH